MTDEDKKLADLLIVEIENTLLASIEITAKDVKKKYGIEVDTEKLKKKAHEWAKKKAAESAKSINETNAEIVKSEQSKIDAVEKEADNLPQETKLELQKEIEIIQKETENFFVETRAEEIAITETTAALSQGNMMVWIAAGIETKQWITEQDEAVCEICQENEDDGELDMSEIFSSGDIEPPAHPSCRCFLSEVM